MQPTDKQLALIRSIEQSRGIKFEGSTKQEAWLWTKANLPSGILGNEVTMKQRAAIDNVQEALGIVFRGNTKDAARSWLSEFMPLAVDEVYRTEAAAHSSRTAKVSGVHQWQQSPTANHVAYLELVDSFTEYPDAETLNLQINILKMGFQQY